VRAKFSASVQTGPGAHPAFCAVPGLFPGGNADGRGVNHPPPHLSSRLKKE
jgi:hypothetical protein